MNTSLDILLVAQPGEARRRIESLLQRSDRGNYHIDQLIDPDAALPAMVSREYDLVLLLWQDDSCREPLTRARSHGCHQPIVVLTDTHHDHVDRQAIALGAADYLIIDELDPERLERKIRYAIERKAVERQLGKLAHFDALTGIPNRILFGERLDHAVNLAGRDGKNFAVMYLDLDGFKQINDKYGHNIGDALICAVAERLRSCLRASDSVARIGGDEFTLLLEDTDSSSDLAHIAEKIIDIIARPYELDRVRVNVGCSIGIAVYPEAGRDSDQLMRNADMAMYRAKEESGNNFSFYTEAMNTQARQRLHLEADLRRAVGRQQFSLQYQPRFDLHSGEICSVEALLRWNHPLKGALTPEQFLAVAEDSGLIIELGYWVIRRACLDLILLRQHGLNRVPVAINLSARQFSDERLVERVGKILHDTGVDGRLLEFELSETDLADNLEALSLCMRALAHLGISFSLDDFGTSASSFTSLQQLPINALMIDGSFIDSMFDSERSTQLVAAMINLGQSLDKQVIAEAVETEKQLYLLRQFGCNLAQGYLLQEPLEFSDLCDLLDQRNTLAQHTHRPRSISLSTTADRATDS